MPRENDLLPISEAGCSKNGRLSLVSWFEVEESYGCSGLELILVACSDESCRIFEVRTCTGIQSTWF